jgi:hypothetical protein
MKKLLVASMAVFALAACKKVEGEGGRSSISGKITVDHKLYVNGLFQSTVSYDGAKEDVYIIYGDGTEDVMYDDKIEASYDGSFKFEFLQPGTYTVFAYSEIFNPGPNISNNDDDYYTLEKVGQTITIGKKEDATVGTLNVIK